MATPVSKNVSAVNIGKVSKNARVGGTVTEKFYHNDGGQILVTMKFRNGKLIPEAECQLCHAVSRRVKDLAV
jgi:hypothetical protein